MGYSNSSEVTARKVLVGIYKALLTPFLRRKWSRDVQVKKWVEGDIIQSHEWDHLLFEWEKFGSASARPHKAKQAVIKKYQIIHHCKTLVETGTFLGDMLYAQMENFEQLYSIELSEPLWKDAKKRFSNYPKINLLLGDSGRVLLDLVPQLDDSTLFWLDGHYSGGITAKGEKECPIFEELSAIFKSSLDKVILIDDARYFIGQKTDYPAVSELKAFLQNNAPEYALKIEEDIIILEKTI